MPFKKKLSSMIGFFNLKKNPYTKIEKKYNYIYIHIPKTGGNGILKSLFGQGGTGHKRLLDYYKYDKARFNRSYKFTVVRHPYDRFVSAFYYLKSGGISDIDVNVFKKALVEYDDVNEFIEELQVNSLLYFNVFNYIHFKSQSFFLSGEIFAKSIDFIGRQEEMGAAFDEIKKHLDVDPSLELKRSNKTPPYDKELTDKSKRFLYMTYMEDFFAFGYDNDL